MVATDTPRVWIGSLAAYNAGRLIGEWVDADDLDTLQEAAERVLKRGGGEEIALMDREGFGDLIGEYTQLERVAEIAQAIEEHGEPFVIFWTSEPSWFESLEIGEASDTFEEAYCGGGWDSMRDYAENLAEELGAIPDDLSWPLTHIDWEGAARELEIGDGYWIQDGHVFRSV